MNGLLDFVKTPEGQGLLSAAFGGLAGARRGQPINSLGRAGLAGLAGYSGAQDRVLQQDEAAVQKQFRDMQMQTMKNQQAQQQAQQEWRTGLSSVLQPKPQEIDQFTGTTEMVEPSREVIQKYLMDPRSPIADKMLEQQFLPKAEDYRVVGGDLIKIGGNGVTVAHQSQRPDNIPSEQKLYNLAVEQGYKGTFLNFLRDRVSNTEGAKAAFDPMTITAPDGTTTIRPRSAVMGEAGGGSTTVRPAGNFTGPGYAGGSATNASTEQRTILEREREKAVAEGRAQDVAALDRELGRLPGGALGMRVQSEAEKQAAAIRAKNEAEAQSPAAIAAKNEKRASIQAQIGVIDKAINHPGRETATGLSGQIDPRNYFGGTDATDFKVVLDQLGGAAFLQAFESLKGGGQITEVEGKKATDAIARLNRAQSDGEFEVALRDLREIMTNGLSRLEGTGGASGNFDSPKPAQAFDSKPPAQQYKGKTMRGPDGKRYQSDGMVWKEVQ